MPSAVVGALRVDLGVNSAQFTTGMRQAGSAVQTLGRQASATAGPMRGLTAQLQNTSYQVQDVIVQITGGTSALRALGQQLPQLLSGFGLFGAIGGTVAAAVLGLADGFLRSGDTAKSADEAVKGLTEAMTAAKAASDLLGLSQAELSARFGSFAEGTAVAINRAKDALLATTDEVRAIGDTAFAPMLNALEVARGSAQALGIEFVAGVDDVRQLASALKLPEEQIRILLAAQNDFNGAVAAPEMRSALVNIYNQLSAWADEMGTLPPLAAELHSYLGGVIDRLGEATNEATGLAGALSAAATQAARVANLRRQASTEDPRTGPGRGTAYNPMADVEDSRNVWDRGVIVDYATSAAIAKAEKSAAGGGKSGGGLPKISAEAKQAQQHLKDLVREANQLHDVELREIDRAAEQMGDTFSDAFLGAIDGSKSLQESLADLAGDLARTFVSAGFSGLAKGTGFAALLQGIMPYAGGTQFARGGLSLVGERGPEFVSLPRGAKVTPNASLGGNVFTFAPVIDARGADQAAVARAMTAQAAQFEDFKRSMPDRVAHIRRDPRYKG